MTQAHDAAAASFAALTHKLDYLDEADIRRVREAYRFADEAHLGQFRASGEPYITHPIAVAGLCADWKLDAQAIMAALMHDAMEDCGVTKIELIERFGAPTAELVDGLTKLDKLQFSTKEESQAESFRKMLLAMARDVRVILIKLADRLHNMRTMAAMLPEKRARIARETIEIYVPIAHRLGLNQTYRELQELSFQYINPWRYGVLAKAVKRTRGNRRDLVERIRREVELAFKEADMDVEVYGREKTIYSIYHKMVEKHLSFAQVSDIFGFRIVTRELLDCYRGLGVLHQLYKPLPGRFKDYIAIPKANGYQSLHTTLVNPVGTAVEFQLRSQAMHGVAEKGIAAHWMYKAQEGGQNRPDTTPQQAAVWLQSLIDIQQETRDSAEFLEHLKIDLFPESVYVFTPKSRIMALPKGATAVDFAYAIHSRVGDHCVAAKINGESAALRTELHSGDVVEIITSPSARPNPNWLNFVSTGRARSKIRAYLKNMESEESLELGEKLLSQALRAEGLTLPPGDETSEGAKGALWQALIRWGGNRNRHDLMVDIGLGRKISTMVAKRMAQILAEAGQRPDALTLTMGRYAAIEAHTAGAVVIDGSEGATVQLAPCCHPIPGDAIVGYLGRGEGLVIHTHDCSVGKRLYERDKERWIDVSWSEEPTRSFEAVVSVLVTNGKGVLAQVASSVSDAETDITHIEMGDERIGESAELKITVSVRDVEHLEDVLRVLRRCPVVLNAHRVCP
ncbi:bifunctional (p)ppGpp synthetase/guanosine-3',5'-bis(diphosphate) 3'-pyrophosphohydrolase [Aquabacterium sp.]|uniref:RelA/SpoT family protein n=1 Tax=Aquabacterium sp. TaxID=1872578 RepID=UPI0035B0AC21